MVCSGSTKKGGDGMHCKNKPPHLHAPCDELQNAVMVGDFLRMKQ
jgi:hypothetical protein